MAVAEKNIVLTGGLILIGIMSAGESAGESDASLVIFGIGYKRTGRGIGNWRANPMSPS